MNKQEQIETRTDFLCNYFRQHVGEKIPFNRLNEALQQKELPVLKKSSWPKEIGVLASQIPELRLTVLGRRNDFGEVLIESTADFELGIRRYQRPETKRQLGQVIWNVLMGSHVFEGLPTLPDQDDAHAEMTGAAQRLAAMRSGGMLTVYLDAGSTTEAVAEQLGLLDDLSGPMKEVPKGVAPISLRPRLRIVTSSISIAKSLAESRHRNSLEVFAVGGQVWPQYMSMAGLVAQKLLPIYGELFNNCVAVVGATGYRPTGARGGASLLCTSMEEMFVKDWLLRNADFRIAVFDATKLKDRFLPRAFAPLRAVDLVVTDDGTHVPKHQDLPTIVDQFCDQARSLGVATLVARAAPEEGDEAA